MSKHYKKISVSCSNTFIIKKLHIVLLEGEYIEKDEQPYCPTCHIKKFKSAAPTIQIESNKCAKCNLNVYKNEEILAATRHWHKTCFACYECTRVLTVDKYLDHNSDPYCIPCFERLFSDAEKLNELNLQSGVGHKKTHLTEMELMKQNYANVNDAPHCSKCEKVVYKYDQHSACGKMYHKSCFTCGGSSKTKACQQLLSLKNYNTHDDKPYCNHCLSTLFNLPITRKLDDQGKEITGLREPVILKEDWEAEDPWAHTGIEEGREFWHDTITEMRHGPKTIITENIDVQGSSTNSKTKQFLEEVQKLK